MNSEELGIVGYIDDLGNHTLLRHIVSINVNTGLFYSTLGQRRKLPKHELKKYLSDMVRDNLGPNKKLSEHLNKL